MPSVFQKRKVCCDVITQSSPLCVSSNSIFTVRTTHKRFLKHISLNVCIYRSDFSNYINSMKMLMYFLRFNIQTNMTSILSLLEDSRRSHDPVFEMVRCTHKLLNILIETWSYCADTLMLTTTHCVYSTQLCKLKTIF